MRLCRVHEERVTEIDGAGRTRCRCDGLILRLTVVGRSHLAERQPGITGGGEEPSHIQMRTDADASP